MKIIKSRINGVKKTVTVEIGIGEELIAIALDAHYKLGYPVEDVVGSHIILEAKRVTWCSASQEWVA